MSDWIRLIGGAGRVLWRWLTESQEEWERRVTDQLMADFALAAFVAMPRTRRIPRDWLERWGNR